LGDYGYWFNYSPLSWGKGLLFLIGLRKGLKGNSLIGSLLEPFINNNRLVKRKAPGNWSWGNLEKLRP